MREKDLGRDVGFLKQWVIPELKHDQHHIDAGVEGDDAARVSIFVAWEVMTQPVCLSCVSTEVGSD